MNCSPSPIVSEVDIASEIAAVQSRIAQIMGTPPIEALPSAGPQGPDGLPKYGPGAASPEAAGQFASLVAAALERAREQGFISGSPLDARSPNPVAPAAIEQLVDQNAATWQVDPALIKAVIANESAFDANATSRAGAMGLMQLMPETASKLGVANAYNPAQNVAGGTRYLKGLLQRFNGDLRLAIAAYNAGPQAVDKHGGIPPYAETQNYVTSVLGSYARYRATLP
jgi:soluble lytic murein transglycosylase-like protein